MTPSKVKEISRLRFGHQSNRQRRLLVNGRLFEKGWTPGVLLNFSDVRGIFKHVLAHYEHDALCGQF